MLIFLLGKTKLVLNNKKRFRIRTISISCTISVIVTIRLNYKSESALPRCLNEKKKKKVKSASSFAMLGLLGKSWFVGLFFSCKILVLLGLLWRKPSSSSTGLKEQLQAFQLDCQRGQREERQIRSMSKACEDVSYNLTISYYLIFSENVLFSCSPILLVHTCMI